MTVAVGLESSPKVANTKQAESDGLECNLTESPKNSTLICSVCFHWLDSFARESTYAYEPIMKTLKFFASVAVVCAITTSSAHADENLLGYVKGAETLPEGATEIYQVFTSRDDKGEGSYHALDWKTEVEYGITSKFSVSGALMAQMVKLEGLIVDGYLPMNKDSGLQPSAVEASMKYNFLSAVNDWIGFSTYFSVIYGWLDPHSGQRKTQVKTELTFIFQKYFLDDQFVWNTNLGVENTYARRAPLDTLPTPGYEWPTDPEVELEVVVGTGVSYRFMPGWFAGAETQYEAEYETEVGRERYTIFAGPSIHYASQKWWGTFTYFHQMMGGGEKYTNQADDDLHLIEKTKSEMRLKLGWNF